MATPEGAAASDGWPPFVTEVVDEAVGRGHRTDPHLPGTGGPAGNARLTAWTGLLLLALFLGELVTLLNVRGLMSWHVVLGTLLIPPSLIKTASTGWRIVRYYRGNPPYRRAGPPPMVLRVLGPLVVASTLGLLGSGVLLIVLGPDSSRNTMLSLLGQRVDWVTVHQGFFLVWAVVTSLHVLGRLVPAWRLAVSRPAAGSRVDGRGRRSLALAMTAVVAAASAVVVLGAAGGWRHDQFGFDGRFGYPPFSHDGH